FQDLEVRWREPGKVFDDSIPLYRFVARKVTREWNKNGNCAVVAGAPYPQELKEVREDVGDMPSLIPGIGAQGGDVKATIKAGQDSRKQGMIINLSRSVLYASSGEDFAEAARAEVLRVHNLINQFR
ncbi:MAG: orotidine 5'-phosphate decarboxylase, partial [Patescibacteria group bacterium]